MKLTLRIKINKQMQELLQSLPLLQTKAQQEEYLEGVVYDYLHQIKEQMEDYYLEEEKKRIAQETSDTKVKQEDEANA